MPTSFVLRPLYQFQKSVNVVLVSYENWLADALQEDQQIRDKKWTESLAVGGQLFVKDYLDKVGVKASYRQVKVVDDCHVVKEPYPSYNSDL